MLIRVQYTTGPSYLLCSYDAILTPYQQDSLIFPTLMHASKDILWIYKLLTELACVFSFSTPTTLFCDNQGAIQLSHDSMFHSCTKHIR